MRWQTRLLRLDRFVLCVSRSYIWCVKQYTSFRCSFVYLKFFEMYLEYVEIFHFFGCTWSHLCAFSGFTAVCPLKDLMWIIIEAGCRPVVSVRPPPMAWREGYRAWKYAVVKLCISNNKKLCEWWLMQAVTSGRLKLIPDHYEKQWNDWLLSTKYALCCLHTCQTLIGSVLHCLC